MGKKNYGKSVKTRLLNLMNETGYKYMYLLARYFNERLLYRVSVTPYPTTIDFPLLLPDIPSVNIQAYSLETVVAEKFHTMIDRDVLNSRMKDFFDCYQLLTKRDLDDETLYDAIKATFDNRGLTYNPELQLFTEDFSTDVARITRWKAFLKKIQWKETLDFETVMAVIRKRLQPMAEKYWK